MAKKKSKAKPKKAKAKTKKPAKRVAAKAGKAKTKKSKKPAKAAVKKAKKAAPKIKKAKKAKKAKAVKKKKQVMGEGDYQATRRFDKDQSNFVKRNAAAIPAMGKAAEAALDGPEGDALRDAEAAAAGRSRDNF